LGNRHFKTLRSTLIKIKSDSRQIVNGCFNAAARYSYLIWNASTHVRLTPMRNSYLALTIGSVAALLIVVVVAFHGRAMNLQNKESLSERPGWSVRGPPTIPPRTVGRAP
jgi:hypothetical protein